MRGWMRGLADEGLDEGASRTYAFFTRSEMHETELCCFVRFLHGGGAQTRHGMCSACIVVCRQRVMAECWRDSMHPRDMMGIANLSSSLT